MLTAVAKVLRPWARVRHRGAPLASARVRDAQTTPPLTPVMAESLRAG